MIEAIMQLFKVISKGLYSIGPKCGKQEAEERILQCLALFFIPFTKNDKIAVIPMT